MTNLLDERAREQARDTLIASIPRWYRPTAHLCGTAGIGLSVWIVSIVALVASPPRALDTLVPPVVFLIANGLEWVAHKKLLHKRRWPLHELFDRHTPEHHAVYVDGAMAMKSFREARLVLIPAVGVLGVVVTMGVLGVAFAAVFGTPAGWLLVLTASTYMVGYELSHLAYHLPDTHFIGRLRLVAWLREHHSIHHDPTVMQTKNFNVTIPIFDWIMGTAVTRRDRKRAAPCAPNASATTRT